MRSALFDFRRAMRQMETAGKSLLWAMTHRSRTDRERYAFRLAVAHIRDGRFDLAVEDLNWLGGYRAA